VDFHINPFVRRQTKSNPFTHFMGGYFTWADDKQLLDLTQRSFDAGQYIPGYRDGVILVTVSPNDFYTGLTTLKEGDKLVGKFKARQKGEEPRISIYVDRKSTFLIDVSKMTYAEARKALKALSDKTEVNKEQTQKQQAKLVHVVCYSHDVLNEDGDADSDKPWEIISINGYPTLEEAPIDPFTLMHNHFKSSGGTHTTMDAETFENELCKSFTYWKNKAFMQGELP